MSGLDDVDGTSRGHTGDTKAKDETTSLPLANRTRVVKRGAIDDTSDHDDPSADAHTDFSTPGVDGWTDERQSADAANLIHSRIDSLPLPNSGSMEELQELRVRCQTAEERSIVSIHGLTEAAK